MCVAADVAGDVVGAAVIGRTVGAAVWISDDSDSSSVEESEIIDAAGAAMRTAE